MTSTRQCGSCSTRGPGTSRGFRPWGRNDILELFCETIIDGQTHSFTDFTLIGGLSADATPIAAELTLDAVGSELTFQPFTDMHVLLARPLTEPDILDIVLHDDPTRRNQIGGWTKFATTVDVSGVAFNVWVSNQLLTFSIVRSIEVG